MEINTKNKFFKYIAIATTFLIIGCAGLTPSVIVYIQDYTNFLTNGNPNFWIGYVLVVAMICSIAIMCVSILCMWKLIYDYRWRIKQDAKGVPHD